MTLAPGRADESCCPAGRLLAIRSAHVDGYRQVRPLRWLEFLDEKLIPAGAGFPVNHSHGIAGRVLTEASHRLSRAGAAGTHAVSAGSAEEPVGQLHRDGLWSDVERL